MEKILIGSHSKHEVDNEVAWYQMLVPKFIRGDKQGKQLFYAP